MVQLDWLTKMWIWYLRQTVLENDGGARLAHKDVDMVSKADSTGNDGGAKLAHEDVETVSKAESTGQ